MHAHPLSSSPKNPEEMALLFLLHEMAFLSNEIESLPQKPLIFHMRSFLQKATLFSSAHFLEKPLAPLKKLYFFLQFLKESAPFEKKILLLERKSSHFFLLCSEEELFIAPTSIEKEFQLLVKEIKNLLGEIFGKILSLIKKAKRNEKILLLLLKHQKTLSAILKRGSFDKVLLLSLKTWKNHIEKSYAKRGFKEAIGKILSKH